MHLKSSVFLPWEHRTEKMHLPFLVSPPGSGDSLVIQTSAVSGRPCRSLWMKSHKLCTWSGKTIRLPVITLNWNTVTAINSNFTLLWAGHQHQPYYACHWSPLLHVESIKFPKTLNFWRCPAKPQPSISTAQASQGAWSGFSTRFCSFSNALNMEILPDGAAPNTETYHSVSQIFVIKRLKLTVECWMGIQAGVSTEHLWDGHLPWLCCK